MCPKGIKADWIIYHDRQSDEIEIKNFEDYTKTKDDNDHIRCGVKLIEDHKCTNLLDFDEYLKCPDLCVIKFHIMLKFMFVGVRNYRNQHVRRCKKNSIHA